MTVEYRERVRRKYEELDAEKGTVEGEWRQYKDAFVEVAEELCGRTSGKGAAPDLGLGRLGSCPGASTKKGLHKSTHFFNMAESYSVCHRGLLVNVCKFHFNYAFYTPLLRPVLRQCISHEWNVQWPSSQGSSKEQPGGLDTLCRALAKPSC